MPFSLPFGGFSAGGNLRLDQLYGTPRRSCLGRKPCRIGVLPVPVGGTALAFVRVQAFGAPVLARKVQLRQLSSSRLCFLLRLSAAGLPRGYVERLFSFHRHLNGRFGPFVPFF